MRSFDVSPKMIFSTQLNYDQALMGLTQDKDRERLVIANSIDKVNPKLKDEIAIFGGNINYEWVEYATLVGINYLYNGGNSSLIPTQVVNNQVAYNPKLYKSTEVGFLEIK
jgi:menaquinone-dependent protoporphyrinogen IX oxidase